MKKIFVIIKREFMTRAMTKGFIISTLLVPILLIGFMGLQVFLMSQKSEESVTIGVMDKSGIVYQGLFKTLDDTLQDGQRKYKIAPLPVDSAIKDESAFFANFIRENVFDVIIVIPENVLDSSKVEYYAKKISNYDLIRIIRDAINNTLTEYKFKLAGIDVQKIQKLKSHVSIETIKVTKKEVKQSSAAGEYITGWILMLLLYVTLLMYGTYIWKGIVEDKVSKIVEVLLSSVNAIQFMFGKIFGNALIGLAQILIWGIFILFGILAGLAYKPEILKLISLSPAILFYFALFFMLGFFLYATFFAIVGSVSGSTDDAQQLQSPITIIIVVAFLIGASALTNPGASYVEVLSYIPFFTPIVMFSRILSSDPPVLGIIASIVITIITIILMTILTAKIFRVGILMTGKRPTLPEILKWLKK